MGYLPKPLNHFLKCRNVYKLTGSISLATSLKLWCSSKCHTEGAMKSTYKKKKKDWSGTLRASFKAQGPLLASAGTCTCVCVCVCVYLWHVHICMHIHMCVVCLCAFTCVCAVCTVYVCMCISSVVCMCACMFLCVGILCAACVCVCVHACMCPCVYNKGNQKIFFKN